MPELHNKIELLRERTGPLLRLLGPCLQIHFYLTLLTGKIPIISYIRPFGCHVTILNTIDHLGKFDGKSDKGFLVGYSLNSKVFGVYNLETKRVEENLHITFLENKLNVIGKGPNWLFDLDYLTDSMNYQPVRSENQANKTAGPEEANHNASTQDNIDAGNSEMEAESAQDYFVLPIWSSYTSTVKSSKAKNKAEALKKEFAQDTDFINLDATMNVSLIPTSRIHTIHLKTKILGDPTSAVQTRSKVNKSSGAHAFVSYIQKQRRNNHKDFQHCLFACFLSQIEPKKISEALEDESWVDAMQEELNKKDERGVMVRNKARLVAQGHRQEEGKDYEVAERKNKTLIEAARTMLADLFLPNTFWAEAVSTACYVLNRPVRSENQANKTADPEEANHSAGTQDNIDAGNSKMELKLVKENSKLHKDLLRLEKFKVCMKDRKRVIDDFKPMDSDDAVKDSKEAAGVHKQKVREEPNSTKVEVKQEGYEESIKKRPGRRLLLKLFYPG
ncbi:putative ribonuclease H-like domain-containing protein, partial [Tanacetum coccineum]